MKETKFGRVVEISPARRALEHAYIVNHIQQMIDGPGIPRGDSVNVHIAIPDVIELQSLKRELGLPSWMGVKSRTAVVSVPNPDDRRTWSYKPPKAVTYELQPQAAAGGPREEGVDRAVAHAHSLAPRAYVREMKQAEGYGAW